MRLRLKALAGFIILAAMLLVAGAWSIYESRSISLAVQDLLDDNYRSIVASKTMLEALEREDSGILLLMLGKWQEGREIIYSADSAFLTGLDNASNNLTIPGEDRYVGAIGTRYRAYKDVWEKPIVDTHKEGNLNWYFESIHVSFREVKSAVNDLMALNDKVMFETASSLREKANRAIMPGVVAVFAALVFSIMFSYFVNLYIVNPIVLITTRIKKFIHAQVDFDVRLDTKDELSDLADSIRTLVGRIGEKSRNPRARE